MGAISHIKAEASRVPLRKSYLCSAIRKQYVATKDETKPLNEDKRIHKNIERSAGQNHNGRKAVIELHDVKRDFVVGDEVVHALRGVSFKIYEGEFVTLNKKYKKRFQMKGGITGLAQCKGRNENSWDEKVTLDNEYIDRFKKEGFWLDIKIIWWTIAKVFQSANINEEQREGMSAEESAALDDEEVKRIAHLPDEE